MRHSTLLIYGSGSVVSVGAKSVDTAQQDYDAIVSEAREHNVPVRPQELKLVNIAATSAVPTRVNFQEFYEKNKHVRMLYEPDMMRGIMLYLDCGAVMLHHTGKFNIVGCKSLQDVERTVLLVRELV